jgi:excisionase family DNA binding protein
MTASLPARRNPMKSELAIITDVIDGEIFARDDRRRPYSYELLLTPEDVASVLSIGRTRVYELMNSDALRSVKIGKSRRVRRTDLDEYIVGLTP